MLIRRLIILLKKARLAYLILKRPPPTLLCRSYLSSVTYGGLGPAVAGPASPASYVVVPFLPLLCDVRRPRAGRSRPGVTVSGAPAKLLPTA
ncbi:hypothetical protein L249_6030 [Ophiocordyceps polyrhachis-furcata BCC 54312]|uniref:Uncharacterized protein n=1 Tax=Ophiocordyceps polyrhachis-furcata BCC 54312 TaxID=1330021 RepID=A0A367LIG3_9HYPO|nr:hypothetical protein L249_6030 [Ophiocordyceps polyrhachis-furcata BCC 54312]